jgi:CMP-N,N'-diacetyllegionaminic acid synthase
MITAIIPARGGSKRLPGKNIKLLNGRPLIFHSLDAVLNHAPVTKIVFTTDSDEYIDLVVHEYGDSVVIEKRPEYYASDTTKVHDEVVRLSETNVIDTDWFMLCLPTAPLRSHDTVASLLQAWEVDYHARFSASSYGFPIQFAFDIDADGAWEPIADDSPMLTGNTRSQDIPTRYRPNGAIYLQRTDRLRKDKTFYIDAKPFLISEIESTDVDTEIDFKFAEILIAERDK